MTLQIGSIVHFVYGDVHHAAIVTRIEADEVVTLLCFAPNELPYGMPMVAHDEGRQPGTWHWPES